MMKRIAVVIVSFNNAAMLRHLLTDLSVQQLRPHEVVVVDNASVDDTLTMVSTEFPEVKIIKLQENIGSAGGYYTGIKSVMMNVDGIWTLDDDVRLNPDSLKNLVEGYNTLSKKIRLGAVRSVCGHYAFNGPVELEFVPWRGSLWVGDVVRRMGPPRPDYFLYGEDLEYSLRMKKLGYCCYWVPSSQCLEVRQGKTDKNIFGKQIKIYPTPFRLYYAFRSEINIYLSYHRFDKLFQLGLYAIKVIGFVLLTERKRALPKITAVLTGLIHGLTGRLGKNTRFLP